MKKVPTIKKRNKKSKKKSANFKTRKKERDLLEKFKFASELLKIINHFFPELIPSLKIVIDPRNKSYIKYETEIILFTRILSAIFQIESMRSTSSSFNSQIAIDNMEKILDKDDLLELPHYDTINDFLSRLEPKELEKIITKLTNRLIRMRTFETSRIFDKYWQILIDGTGIYCFNEKHCEHCLTKTFNKGTQKEYTLYYHYVLEAKLVFFDEIAISIVSEFIENESPDVKKQDCETKAFYRLAEKLKSAYPRLPICLSMDSLYAQQKVFKICKENKWAYIITFKDGSIKSLSEEFRELKYFAPDIEDIDYENGKYKYVGANQISYHGYKLNMIEYVGVEGKEKKNIHFAFITSFIITEKSYKNIVYYGRLRWTIENQGFNEQKKHGFYLEHVFSRNYTAMKNHYYLIQIAHMISQIFEKSSIIYKQTKLSTKEMFKKLKSKFIEHLITDEDIESSKARFQARFEFKRIVT